MNSDGHHKETYSVLPDERVLTPICRVGGFHGLDEGRIYKFTYAGANFEAGDTCQSPYFPIDDGAPLVRLEPASLVTFGDAEDTPQTAEIPSPINETPSPNIFDLPSRSRMAEYFRKQRAVRD